MTDVLTHNPETKQPKGGNRLQRLLAKVGMSRSKSDHAPEGPSPYSREGLPADQLAALEAREALAKERIAREANDIGEKVNKQYSDPESVYNKQNQRADALRQAAVDEVFNQEGDLTKAGRYMDMSKEQRQFGNDQVQNTFTSSKNGVTKQDVMDALHGQAIAEDTQRASGDFVEPVATGRVTTPQEKPAHSDNDPAEAYFRARGAGYSVANGKSGEQSGQANETNTSDHDSQAEA